MSVPSTSERQEMDSFLCRCCHQYLLKLRPAAGSFALDAFRRTSVSFVAQTLGAEAMAKTHFFAKRLGALDDNRVRMLGPAIAFPGSASDSLPSQVHQHSFEEEVGGMSNRLTQAIVQEVAKDLAA